jgi:hypothetical protein
MSIESRIRASLRERADRVESVRDRSPELERDSSADRGPDLSGPRRLVSAVVALALFAASAILVWSAFRPTESRTPAPVSTPSTTQRGELIEPMTEREGAEVFAVRAVAAAGLMDPVDSRSFGFTYRDDTTRTASGWRVGFAAMDCEPKGTGNDVVFTCRGLSGDEPDTGNAVTDAYVTVALDGGTWTVVGFDGNVLDDERIRLVGSTLPQQTEPSHWEFPAVATARHDGVVTGFESVALWVGPYPTEAMGSVCDARALAADGEDLGSVSRWYEEAPDRPFNRVGWVHAQEIGDAPPATSDISIRCRQYTGLGWTVVVDPSLVRQDGEVVGVRIELEWQGAEDITTPAECTVEILNQSGEVIWEGRGRAESLWPQPDPNGYPYHTQVFIPIGPDGPTRVDHIGAFDCRMG